KQVESARILGRQCYQLAKYFGSLGRLTLGQIRGAQKDAGRDHARLPGDKGLQVLDGRLYGARLDVQLGQQEHGLSEVGGGRYRILKLCLCLLKIADLELGEPKLVACRGIPRVKLQHLLELLDRLIVLALGQAHAASQEMPFEVGGILLQQSLQSLEALVVLALLEGDLSQPPPCGEI